MENTHYSENKIKTDEILAIITDLEGSGLVITNMAALVYNLSLLLKSAYGIED